MTTKQRWPWGWVWAGAIGFAVLACVAGVAALNLGLVPANADAKPSSLERWAARTSLHATIARAVTDERDPLPQTTQNIGAGITLYGANCIVCHGASDGKASNVASGLYQPAPQLGSHGVEDDPEAETHWKIAHGIRLTGMPSFDRTLTDAQVWQLTQFLAHMDKLAPAQKAAWKKLPSQAPVSKSAS
jgi:thiosulfate dehydrogenase